MSKTRIDCWEAGLTDGQKQQVFEWMTEFGGPKTIVMVQEAFSVTPAMSSLYRFFHRKKVEHDEDRLRRAIATKSSIEQTCKELGDVDATLAKGLAYYGLDAIATGDPKLIEKAIMTYNDLLRRQTYEGELEFKKEKFRNDIRTQQERALDALFQDIKGNPEAEELFNEMRTVIMEATRK